MRTFTIRSGAPGAFRIDYEKELNPEQLEAVVCPEGPALVLAGAGTGKTRTVTYRVARLIESGMKPDSLMLVTFTNKAAREMLQRVESVLGLNLRGLWGGTFHHIGNILLRRHAKLLGYESNYSILDREDAVDLVDTCVADAGIDKQRWRFPKADIVQSIISLTVNTGDSIARVVSTRMPHFIPMAEEIEKVAVRYELRKQELNVMDFDDLLSNWLRLMREQPAVLEQYGSQFRQILVDEYQDTNYIQAAIIDLMASSHKNLFVVGDDAQSIYSFRGADFENIISFPKRYADARVFRLTTNYRSTPEILSLANASIRQNRRQFKKELHAVRPEGQSPALLAVRDVYQQAGFVAQRMMDLHGDGMDFGKMAVLYRSHYQSMEIQMELTRHGIPFEIRSGLRFFEQAHIKDVTAYLRIAVNPKDEIAWFRVLRLIPGVGKVSAKKIGAALIPMDDPLGGLIEGAADKLVRKASRKDFDRMIELMARLRAPDIQANPAEMIRMVMAGGYEEYLFAEYPNASARVEDIEQLAEYSTAYAGTAELLSSLALVSTMGDNAADDEGENEKVVLSSIHQAKGLEWAVVFLIWLCEGRFPSARAVSEQDEEEERRLFYVATTRAREELYLLYPRSAPGAGGTMLLGPSRFILELPGNVYERCAVEERYVY
ncbi:MAG: ATP-dependent helicase [Nitrospirae bacterium]|nr:ATP-dependent helicase [Nitrospirota bacterium]